MRSSHLFCQPLDPVPYMRYAYMFHEHDQFLFTLLAYKNQIIPKFNAVPSSKVAPSSNALLSAYLESMEEVRTLATTLNLRVPAKLVLHMPRALQMLLTSAVLVSTYDRFSGRQLRDPDRKN